MKKKALIMLLCAALVISSAALGTIAYLTDRTQITNTFTVGKVNIKLDETDVDADGQPIPDPNTGLPVRKEEGNEYHLVPGQTYMKDPAVTVLSGSENSYVRMIVRIKDAADLHAIFGTDFHPENYVTGWYSEIWPCYNMQTVGDEIVLEFRYYKEVPASANHQQLEALFTSFTLPGVITGDQLATLDALEIVVEAHAIQSATFADAAAAWAAFSEQYKPSTTVVPGAIPTINP